MIHKVWAKIVAHSSEFAELNPEWVALPATPEAAAAPAIAGTVGQPIAPPASTPPAAAAPHAPTVAIAPETISDGQPTIPAQTPAAATPQPRPQIAEETRHDYGQPSHAPAASTPQHPQHTHQPYSTEESERRAA